MRQALDQLRRNRVRRRFERQLETLLPDLYRLARGLVDEPADADDLTHDVCVKAFAALDDADLPSESACRAWLRKIMINTFRDQYRRNLKSPEVRDTGDGGTTYAKVIELVGSDSCGPEQYMRNRDFAATTDAALRALPPEVRVVVTLHIISGISYKDIAYVTDCPIGTVMSRIANGRRLLRSALQSYRSPETTRRLSQEQCS